jgi:hypothetical protein
MSEIGHDADVGCEGVGPLGAASVGDGVVRDRVRRPVAKREPNAWSSNGPTLRKLGFLR